MSQKKILVPLVPPGWDLKGLHYALALAARLRARVYILQQRSSSMPENPRGPWLEQALTDLINSARQAGLEVSQHFTDNGLKAEIVALIQLEGIDVLVFGADDEVCERLSLQIKPLVPSQIIEVREKDHISYL